MSTPDWLSTWGDGAVEQTQVRGRPGLMYSHRPASVLAAVTASRRWSGRPYIIQGDRVLTFTEHEALVSRIAGRLRAEGVGRGDRVALFAANSPEWVATFFAAMSLGAIAVPCNSWWSAEEMAHAVSVAEPHVVICDDRRQGRVPEEYSTIMTADLTGQDPGSPDRELVAYSEVSEDDPAVILFTAGTTSFPKGAVLSHRALVSNLQTLLTVARKLPCQIDDDLAPSVTLVGLPLFHIGAIQLVLVPLMTGSQIVFLEGRFEAADVLRRIEQHRVTMFSGVPTMMERLLADPDLRSRDVAALRTVVLGGAPVSDHLLERVRDGFPGTVRGVGQTYGLTEAGGVVSTGVGAQIAVRPGSSGRLAPVVEVQIVDADAEGHGKILVRSPAAMDGYYADLEGSGIDAAGWLDTGDVGWVDEDRFLYITGRAKDVIIRGGENVSATRVESVLEGHPAVREVSVVGLPDPDLGEVVGAVVVSDVSPAQLAADLEPYAAQRLAHFAVPTKWWIRREPLPINDSGKVLKRELRARWPAGGAQ
jgi:long-chain acyl-CoA synthetase